MGSEMCIRDRLPAGKISQRDPDLLQVCDDPAEVVRIIAAAHSLASPEQSFNEMT